jgi:hypothetical protein
LGRRRYSPSMESSASTSLRMARLFRTTASMRLRRLCCSSPATFPPVTP